MSKAKLSFIGEGYVKKPQLQAYVLENGSLQESEVDSMTRAELETLAVNLNNLSIKNRDMRKKKPRTTTNTTTHKRGRRNMSDSKDEEHTSELQPGVALSHAV